MKITATLGTQEQTTDGKQWDNQIYKLPIRESQTNQAIWIDRQSVIKELSESNTKHHFLIRKRKKKINLKKQNLTVFKCLHFCFLK